jgi:hypothetical protein
VDGALSEAAPQRLGHYELLEPIGRGGVGLVYRARSEETGEIVALKTLHLLDPEELEGFRREVHTLMRLRHPGVARVLEHGVEEGTPWYAMEFVDGPPLDRLWAPASPSDPLDLPTLLAPLRALCDTLAFLHGEGIVHRDLKPANVLFSREDDRLVLVDFGLVGRFSARTGREALEGGGALVGTLDYMAPEQIRGEYVDARADLYSLGCMLYEAMSGQPPFRGSPAAILEGHLERTPEPPSRVRPGLPRALEALVLRLLAKKPRDRLGYAVDVAAALDSLGRPGGATRATGPARPYLYRSPFVGRSEQLDLIMHCLRECAGGPGRFLVLVGESGSGKTRLAMEATREAQRRGLLVVTCECAPLGPLDREVAVAAPLDPLRPLLRTMADRARSEGGDAAVRIFGRRAARLARFESSLRGLPGVDAAADPVELPADAARQRLVGDLRETFEAFVRESPLFLVIDDLQWADEITLEFLTNLPASFPESSRSAILVTFRKEDESGSLQALCASPPVRRIELDALPQVSVAAIVSEMLALPEAPGSLVQFVASESEGNPFFVCEFLRLALETDVLRRDARGRWELTQPGLGEQSAYESLPVPESVRDLAARRLAGVDDAARATLDAAAILGREFDLDLLGAIAPLEEQARLDALGELFHRQILRATEARRLRFAHDKIREAAYERIPPSRRQALHRLAAEQLETRAASDRESERSSVALAHHWLASGDEPRALFHLERAGEWSLRSGAHREARALLSRAVDIDQRLAGVVPPAQRARHLRLLGEASAGMGDLASSVEQTLAAYSALGGWVPRSPGAHLLALLGAGVLQVGHRLRVRRSSPAASETAAQLAISARDAATTFYFQSDIVRAVTNSLRCINLAERSGQTAIAPLAYAQLGYIAGALRMQPVARTYFGLARSVPREAAQASVFAAGTYFFAMYEMGLGHWQASQDLGEEALGLLEQIDNTQEAEIARTIVANTLYFWGRFRDSERRCREMLSHAEQRGNAQHTGWGLFLTGRSLLAIGSDVEGALELIERGHHYLRQLPDFVSSIMCEGLLAKALWAAGKPERSLEIADALAGRLRARGLVPLAQCLDAYEALASVYLDCWEAEKDPPPAARSTARRACAGLRRFAWMFPMAKPAALRASAREARLLGHERRATRLWNASLDQATALDMKYDEACVHLELARFAGTPGLREQHSREAAHRLAALGCSLPPAADLRRAS